MSRPENREAYRREMAEAFAGILEEKGLEWRKEWNGAGGGAPHNGITGACYRGSNAFWLSLVAMQRGYRDPRWVTMVQIMDRSGKYHPKEKWHLKAGSAAAYVEYWYPYDLRYRRALTWDQYRTEVQLGRGGGEFRLSARYTAVFNACDVEGIPETGETAAENPDIRMDEVVKKLSEGMNVPILPDGGDSAFYSPREDRIHLPAPSSFADEYAFNATALHELAHATGHPTRLNRPETGLFGTAQYAYEELVAEMSSCFMACGLQAGPDSRHLENHRAYVQAWIRTIREKPETLIRAIRDAQGAAGYMDWKAGLISDREYARAADRSFEIRTGERERGAER
jgi:antirestriction protein ArdC